MENKENPKQAVVFDFDGVIADTFDLNLRTLRQFCNTCAEDLKKLHDSNSHETLNIKFTPEMEGNFHQLQREQFKETLFYPITKPIQDLADEFLLFINSSSSEKNIDQFLSLIKLSQCFEKILGVETNRSKVKKFELIFRDYQINPQNCVFITDTLGDLMEGNRVGVKNLAVTWGYHDKQRLKKGNPLVVIDQFEEIVPAVRKIISL